MIDLYYWPTPNGHKISIFLEEAGLPYSLKPVDIARGEQFRPEFLAISPNNRIPAIVDNAPAQGDKPISVFESGAILIYLAEKTGKFLSKVPETRYKTMEWLFWQVGGLGPMMGQNNHFSSYAPEKIAYAIERYRNETARLFRVLNGALEGCEFIAGELSIADMAIYPWVAIYDRQGIAIDEYPHVKRWWQAMKARPSVVAAYEKAKTVQKENRTSIDEEARRHLFGQR